MQAVQRPMREGSARQRPRASATPGALSDEALVDAIAHQDPDAFAEAYERHASRVHALARGLCGQTRAEDLTQEIFLQLWNNPHRFDAQRGSLRGYLLMQAHGRAVGILRTDNARTARESRQNRLAGAPCADAEAMALDLLERAEIEEIVDALPSGERHAIVLAYFGGHTYREVAQLLGVPEGTIKTRIRTGLGRLRSASSALSPSD